MSGGAHDALDAAQTLMDEAREFAQKALAASTRRAYAHDFGAFGAWCAVRGHAPLPALPVTVALYLTQMARNGRKVAGIERALTAISQAHVSLGHASPRDNADVRRVLQGIRRELGCAQVQKDPVLIPDLKLLVSHIDETRLIGLRDRTILLVGFAGSFRRSELVALDVEDITEHEDGLCIRVGRSKTDQEGHGREVGIPYGGVRATCPVRAMRAWLRESGIKTGAVFRGINRHGVLSNRRLHGKDVARAVKNHAEVAGLNPHTLAGHSLRSGLVTAAAKAGKSDHTIMQQTGHASTAMLRRYIRRGKMFEDNAAAGIGL
jgi:site-specific recombinase XerD